MLLSEGIKYAKGRIQFGKPISEFGLIKHKIAEMTVKTYVNESMVYRTAGLLDLALEGIDPTKEEASKKTGEALRKYALECSINKVFGSEMLCYVADECVQIMGGYGYIQENPIEEAYRDCRINRIRSKKWQHFSTSVPPDFSFSRFQSPTFSRNGKRCSRIVSILMPPVTSPACFTNSATGGRERYSIATQIGAP